MTKIKYCGLSRIEDILTVNKLDIDYIGFVFAKKSRRYVTPKRALELKAHLRNNIKTLGVFVNTPVDKVVALYKEGIIDIAQLHGNEDNEYIAKLRSICDIPIFKAFSINTENDIKTANESMADMILLDSGKGGTGTVFDWSLLKGINRDYFLAGGLGIDNIAQAISILNPYGVDVSSGIETDGLKDKNKMIRLASIIREENNNGR